MNWEEIRVRLKDVTDGYIDTGEFMILTGTEGIVEDGWLIDGPHVRVRFPGFFSNNSRGTYVPGGVVWEGKPSQIERV